MTRGQLLPALPWQLLEFAFAPPDRIIAVTRICAIAHDQRRAAPARQPRELAILFTLAAMQFTHILDFMIMMPLGPQFMRMVTGSVSPRLRGSFMSFNASVHQLGSGTAAFLAGLIIGHAADGSLTRYDWVGFLAAGFTLLAVWLAWRIHIVPDGSRAPE